MRWLYNQIEKILRLEKNNFYYTFQDTVSIGKG